MDLARAVSCPLVPPCFRSAYVRSALPPTILLKPCVHIIDETFHHTNNIDGEQRDAQLDRGRTAALARSHLTEPRPRLSRDESTTAISHHPYHHRTRTLCVKETLDSRLVVIAASGATLQRLWNDPEKAHFVFAANDSGHDRKHSKCQPKRVLADRVRARALRRPRGSR